MLQNKLILKRQFPKDAVRRVIIHSIASSVKTLIRYLAILCVIHAGHRFNMLYINTTWDELSSECGAICLLNVGRVVLGRVFFGASCLGASCLLGELIVLFPPVNAHLISEPTMNTKTSNAKFDLVVK